MAALLGIVGGPAGRHGRQRPHQDVADVAAALGPSPGVSPPTGVENRCKTPLAVWLARLERERKPAPLRVSSASSRDLVARTTSIAARSLAVKAGGLGCRWRSCCSVARTGSQWERRRGLMQAKCSFAMIPSHPGVAVTISEGHVILRCAVLACPNATGEAGASISQSAPEGGRLARAAFRQPSAYFSRSFIQLFFSGDPAAPPQPRHLSRRARLDRF